MVLFSQRTKGLVEACADPAKSRTDSEKPRADSAEPRIKIKKSLATAQGTTAIPT